VHLRECSAGARAGGLKAHSASHILCCAKCARLAAGRALPAGGCAPAAGAAARACACSHPCSASSGQPATVCNRISSCSTSTWCRAACSADSWHHHGRVAGAGRMHPWRTAKVSAAARPVPVAAPGRAPRGAAHPGRARPACRRISCGDITAFPVMPYHTQTRLRSRHSAAPGTTV
jgi:hypothetical protein